MALNDLSYNRAVMDSDTAVRYDKEPMKGKRQPVEIPFYYKTARYNRDPDLGIVYRLDAPDRDLDGYLVRKAEKVMRAETHVRIQSSPPRPATPVAYSPSPQPSRSSRRDSPRKSGDCTRRRDSSPSKCRLRRTLNGPGDHEQVMMVLAPGGRVIRKRMKPDRSAQASPCASGGEGDRSRPTSCSRVQTHICPCVCHKGKSIRATCTESVRRLLLRDWAREGRGWNSQPFECEGEGRFVSETDMEVHIHFPPEVSEKDYGQRFRVHKSRSPMPPSLLPSARSRSSEFTSCFRETSFETSASARILAPDSSSLPSQEVLSPRDECPIGKAPNVSTKITKEDLDAFINPQTPLLDGVRSLRTIFSRPCFPHESASSKDDAFMGHRETSLPPPKRSRDDILTSVAGGRKCFSGALLSYFTKEQAKILKTKTSGVVGLGSKPTQTLIRQRIVPEKPSSSESKKRIETRSMTSDCTTDRSRSFGTKSSQDSGSKDRMASPSTSAGPTRFISSTTYRARDSVKHISKDVQFDLKKPHYYNEIPTQDNGEHHKAKRLDSRYLGLNKPEKEEYRGVKRLDSRILGATGSSDSTYDPEYHTGTESPVGRYRHRRDLCYPTCYDNEFSCGKTTSREFYSRRQTRSSSRSPTRSPSEASPTVSHAPSQAPSNYVQKKVMVSLQTRSTCFSEATCLVSGAESRSTVTRPSCASVTAQCSCRDVSGLSYSGTKTQYPVVVRCDFPKPKSEICPNLEQTCPSQPPERKRSGSRTPRSVPCSNQQPPCSSPLLPCPNSLPPCLNTLPPCSNSLPPSPNSLPPCPNSLPPCPNSLPPCPNSLPPRPTSLRPCPSSLRPCPSSLSPCPSTVSQCPSSCLNAYPPCPMVPQPCKTSIEDDLFESSGISLVPCPTSYPSRKTSRPPCPNAIPPCPSVESPGEDKLPPCQSVAQTQSTCSIQQTCTCSRPCPDTRPCDRAVKPTTPSASWLPKICTSFIAPCESDSKKVSLPTCASIGLSPCPSILPRCESVGVSPIPSLLQPCDEKITGRRISWVQKSSEGILKTSSNRTIRTVRCPSSQSIQCEDVEKCSLDCGDLSPSKTSICSTTTVPCPTTLTVCPPAMALVPSVASVRSMLSSAWNRCEEVVTERIRNICGSAAPCASGTSRRICRPSQLTISPCPSRRRCPAGPGRLRATDGVACAYSAPLRPDCSGEGRQASLRSSCPCDVLATSTQCYRQEPSCTVYPNDCSDLPMEVDDDLMMFQWFPSMRLIVFSLILLSHLIALVMKVWFVHPKRSSGSFFC